MTLCTTCAYALRSDFHIPQPELRARIQRLRDQGVVWQKEEKEEKRCLERPRRYRRESIHAEREAL